MSVKEISEEEKAQMAVNALRSVHRMSDEDKAEILKNAELLETVIHEMFNQIRDLTVNLEKFSKQYHDILHHIPYGITICTSFAGTPLIEVVLGHAGECKLCLETLAKGMVKSFFLQ